MPELGYQPVNRYCRRGRTPQRPTKPEATPTRHNRRGNLAAALAQPHPQTLKIHPYTGQDTEIHRHHHRNGLRGPPPSVEYKGPGRRRRQILSNMFHPCSPACDDLVGSRSATTKGAARRQRPRRWRTCRSRRANAAQERHDRRRPRPETVQIPGRRLDVDGVRVGYGGGDRVGMGALLRADAWSPSLAQHLHPAPRRASCGPSMRCARQCRAGVHRMNHDLRPLLTTLSGAGRCGRGRGLRIASTRRPGARFQALGWSWLLVYAGIAAAIGLLARSGISASRWHAGRSRNGAPDGCREGVLAVCFAPAVACASAAGAMATTDRCA